MIGLKLGIRPRNMGDIGPSLTAFSPLRARLAAGQNATIFVNGDSTAHAEAGPFQQFATMLGDLHDTTVVLVRRPLQKQREATSPLRHSDRQKRRSHQNNHLLCIAIRWSQHLR